jgi:hypothetical protein
LNEEILQTNLRRAGEFFMHSLWIQSQMVDLIILNQKPEIHDRFVDNPEQIPEPMVVARADYWTKDFYQVKTEFIEAFNIDDVHQRDLEAVYHLRNAIAHAHVSMGREYFLYRPRGAAREQGMIEALDLARKPDEAYPVTLKLDFHDDEHYFAQFSWFQRLDSTYFSEIAESIGIPHSRVR